MKIEYLGPDEDDASDDCAIISTGQQEFVIIIAERADGIHIKLQSDLAGTEEYEFFAPYPNNK